MTDLERCGVAPGRIEVTDRIRVLNHGPGLWMVVDDDEEECGGWPTLAQAVRAACDRAVEKAIETACDFAQRIEAVTARQAETARFVAECRDSIRQGARRSTHRFRP